MESLHPALIRLVLSISFCYTAYLVHACQQQAGPTSSTATGSFSSSIASSLGSYSIDRWWIFLLLLGQIALSVYSSPATDQINLNFAYSFIYLSSTLLAIYWICQWFLTIRNLLPILLWIAGIANVLPLIFDRPHWINLSPHWLSLMHLILGLVALGCTIFAALLSYFLKWLEEYLHYPDRPLSRRWLNYLPPLLTLEKWVFFAITGAFGLLSLALVTGMGFAETIWGKPLRFDHKTIFVLLAWFSLASLMVGHYGYGWRSRNAHCWLSVGLIFLLLGYLGSKFVLEIVLNRAL